MTKRSAAFDLALKPPANGKLGHRWLYDELRRGILEGQIRPGSRLPATRDLSARYGLSRGTVVNAFEQLKAEGYLEGSSGSGTFVSTVLPDDLLTVAGDARAHGARMLVTQRRLSAWASRVRELPNLERRASRAFRPNVPALDLFPRAAWAQLTARRLRLPSTDVLLGCDAMGYLPLRQAMSDYINASRGVQCTADQITIVGGTQESLDLVTRLFVNPGDRVCIEDPGYEGARTAFEIAGAEIVDVPLDAEGMTVPGEHVHDARLVFVTPAHQCPVGLTMSLRRRLELLEWARQRNALIFEDDYDGEYRYRGRPVPALQGLDRSGCVLFAGSFGKVLFPSLRLGYLVVPPDLVPLVAAAKSATNRHAPLLEQAVLADFITEGHFGRHLRRMREIYAERLSVLQECAREHLAGLLTLSDVEAGLQTSGRLHAGITAVRAVEAARANDVEVTAIPPSVHRPLEDDLLQLGFAAVDTSEVRRGVRALAAALHSIRR